MATFKSFTSLEQAKKLAEFLPIESADMAYLWHSTSDNPTWRYDEDMPPMVLGSVPINELTCDALPCWSLAALLSVFPYYEINNNGVNIQLSVKGETLITEKGEYLLDLAVNMIIHLHEQNLL